jgi:hypothetical protein
MRQSADKSDASRGKTRKTRKRQWDRGAWLAAYEKHGTVTAASKAVGIHRDTAYTARKNDPEFAAEWDKLEVAVTEILEKTAVERALSGSDRLMEFMLKARRPSVYRENLKVEHGGKVTHQVEEGVDEAIDGLLAENERLRDRLAALEPAEQAEAAGSATG